MKIFKTLTAIILIFLAVAISLVHSDVKKISKYRQYTQAYSLKYGVDEILVLSVMKAESNFNLYAKSKKGAIGLMQMLPSTAKDVYIMIYNNGNFNPDMLYDPEINIRTGICYLKILSDKFDGNLNLVLASYNAGLGNVKKWIDEKYNVENNTEAVPFEETKKYVKKIKIIYRYFKFINALKII